MTFSPPHAHLTRPDLRGTTGMAAATHWLAAASAQSVLERGGNAFDAAAAGAFVLHVVEPHLNGPGGDLVAVFATAEEPGRPRVLDGQGPAPAGATIEHYRDVEGLDLVPGSGALAAAVPGAVDAWLTLLRDHGTWSLADVLAPAVGYARDGHPVLAAVCRTVAGVADLFAEHWPTSAARWMPDGRLPQPGDLLTDLAYADLLDGLAEAERVALADGGTRSDGIDAARARWADVVGRAVEEFVATPHRHSDGRDHAGVLTAADVAAYEARYEDAVTVEFRGHTVAKSGAWGQGPALLQALTILDGYDDAHLDPATTTGAHTVLEALKLALADRDAWYGDADVPLDVLLSPQYAAARRALVTDVASAEVRPGEVPGRATPSLPPLRTTYATDAPAGSLPGAPAGGSAAGVGEPTVQLAPAVVAGDGLETDASGRTRGDTCHLDVVDRWGNMVSATPSGGWLQSSPTVPGLGFCLGTRLQMTWLDDASPSRLAPGRRPRTTLTPTLVLRDGQPVLACGSPGGDQQDQWQLPFLLRVLVGGYTPQQAIDAPTLHTTSAVGSFWPRTWTPGGAVVEDRLGADVLAGLAERGHVLTLAGDWALGRLTAVTRDPATGVLGAAANSRGEQGYAVGR
ncbi:gamma-glutamyltransferase family protein [Isoptericola dokdonensis]|uniref:Putative gamma-glutamyltransferase YwrD n=1 Tax=Isoptericola dokdonensis DS-3 TaxID=1300344 RepID=A0A161IKV5_9MICO|nr:gamma-glutamyltransferase [Isoptericola dokdonensis]ANC32864.1 Putative gamma-glutamyltransferase YwrD [Isoptericola dokdonensis DS-3]